MQRGVKDVSRRNSTESTSSSEIKVGKPKSATSKHIVPLNQAAVEAVKDLTCARKRTSAKARPLCATSVRISRAG